jgi:hypothetical protein
LRSYPDRCLGNQRSKACKSTFVSEPADERKVEAVSLELSLERVGCCQVSKTKGWGEQKGSDAHS